MKKLRTILSLIIALMLMLTATAALAAGDGTNSLGSSNTLTIKDKLIAYNPDETSVYAPAVTFSYEIAAGKGSGKVTDSSNGETVILAGNWSGTNAAGTTIAVSGTPTITESNAYTMDNTLKAAKEGDSSNEKDVTVNFASVTFPKGGIYRYVITRTITDNNNALESKDKVTRNLDVYVKEEGATCSIYGYILHDINGDVTGESTAKYDHFESEYKTSNLTVGKTLVNDSAMNKHQFPFHVTLTGTKGAHIMTDANKGTTGQASVSAMAAGDTTSEPKIAHGGIVKYIGIPNGFTASVYETNDVTGTSYSSAGAADTAAAAKIIMGTGDGAKSNEAKTSAAENNTKAIMFTNTLNVISPTGIVLRIAPYALILAAGMALLFIAMKRRGEREEE